VSCRQHLRSELTASQEMQRTTILSRLAGPPERYGKIANRIWSEITSLSPRFTA
jgi:hypothetical protein